MGTLLAVGDISACFRNNPWMVRDKALAGIRDVASPGLVRVDHVISFGFASGPGNSGEAMDALLDILGAIGVSANKWVDDFLFRNQPVVGPHPPHHPDYPLTPISITFILPTHSSITPHSTLAESRAAIPRRLGKGEAIPEGYTSALFAYAYNLQDVEVITSPLGIPWAAPKWQDFSFEADYLGFRWDVWHKRVYLPDPKRLKYLARIDALLSQPRVRLKPLEKVHGCLMHITFVIRLGLSRLPSLQRAMNGFQGSQFMQHTLTSAAHNDLVWWRNMLAEPGAF